MKEGCWFYYGMWIFYEKDNVLTKRRTAKTNKFGPYIACLTCAVRLNGLRFLFYEFFCLHAYFTNSPSSISLSARLVQEPCCFFYKVVG